MLKSGAERGVVWLSAVPHVVLIFAACGKMLAMDDFLESLRSWTILDDRLAVLIAVLLPPLELWVGLGWFFMRWRQRALLTSILLYITFSLFYFYQYSISPPPTCRCLGVLSRYLEGQQSLSQVLTRNFVLAFLAACGLFSTRTSLKPQLREGLRVPTSSRTSGGFSIVECLVTIVIVGILVSLLLVGLAVPRQSAKSAVTLSNLRTHAATWSLYCADYKGVFPFFVEPIPGYRDVSYPDGSVDRIRYLWQKTEWPVFMAESYYAGVSLSSPLFRGPEWPGNYNSPCVFRVDPEHYTERGEPFPRQLRAIGTHEVSVPDRKAFFVADPPPLHQLEYTPSHGWTSGEVFAALCDGGARKIPAASIINWWNSGDLPAGADWLACPSNARQFPMHHTAGGVRSTDIK